jgi:hypothetical protein
VFEYDHIADLTEWVPWLGYTPLITVFASGSGTGDERNGTDTKDMEGGAVQRRSGWEVFVLVVGIWLVVFQ